MAFALKQEFGSGPALHTAAWRVEGRHARRVMMKAGDCLRIESVDGVQGCEVLNVEPGLLADSQALIDASRFGIPEQTLAMLEENSEASGQLTQLLQQWQVTLTGSSLCLPLSGIELSGNGMMLEALGDIELVVVAAATRMDVTQQNAAGELDLILSSANVPDLPDPLAEPVAEYRVPKASALAYPVKEGQWIQIIDVQGKQCSDFVAFDAESLKTPTPIGPLGLDAAATRTVMGHSMPLPGLHSRFYDQNMQAMLEVVQDTVGRHDSFLLACTPKYYEDQGYFGHVSCTDNFNKALAEHGVAPRAGWPAINFFFNTSVADCGAVEAAEPWSRPGDYVLLRANRDLLCASSACPDDIDPANGWKPTDIHVRIYDADEHFPRSIAYRDLPQELPRMTQESGFHPRTSALTPHFVEYHGFWVASEYSGWGTTAEYLACRERVAMIDLSPLRKFEVMGPDAEALLQMALTRNVRKLSIGEVTYTALCQVTGGMIDDGTLFRMCQHNFRLITGDSYVATWLRELAVKEGFQVTVQESTNQIHNVAVQGPTSRELLSQLIWTPEHETELEDLAWFHFTRGRLGGPTGRPVMVSRTGYTGELGFEVWCHPDDAVTVWDAIWEAGQAFDIAPMGFDALDRLRIEAGLIFAGHEFCPQTNPYEAGVGFTVPMKTKEDDFIGREAMKRQAPESRHKLMGLMVHSNEPVAHGDEVFQGRFPVGVITSATYSPILKSQIALVRLAPDCAVPDTELEIGQLDGQQKRIPATVCKVPFYDPERTRVRS